MQPERALTVVERPEIGKDQIDLIKRTVAKGTTDDELRLFLYTAQRTGLDPLAKQIHAIKRGSTMSIQTGIDGYRLIAERTGHYAPGPEPKLVEEGGKIISATAYVKKLVAGTWHEIAATAYFDEYVQRDREGRPFSMWQKMPRLMIAKCAEALALRRAFPAEMSGVYTFEEMAQADNEQPEVRAAAFMAPEIPTSTPEIVQTAEALKAAMKAKGQDPHPTELPMVPKQYAGVPETAYSDSNKPPCPHCESDNTMKSRWPKPGANFFCNDCREKFDA